ncbi:hypothetical protein HanIR_Chr07g0340981 [Helianthus annuus]|nr:hypothetical protein HanIR_Chr07g0340981 [Helianthus annuus]
MAIPWRKVESYIHSSGPCGIRELFHNIAMPVLQRASNDRVVRILGRPKAKPIMVFGGQNGERDSHLDRHIDPLGSVKPFWVKDFWVFPSGAPFGIRKCVDTKMMEENDLSLLPFELRV